MLPVIILVLLYYLLNPLLTSLRTQAVLHFLSLFFLIAVLFNLGSSCSDSSCPTTSGGNNNLPTYLEKANATIDDFLDNQNLYTDDQTAR